MAANCKDCKQPIVWATNSASGRSVPLDPSPDPGLGTLERWVTEDSRGHRTGWVRRLAGTDLHAAIANGHLLWVDHRQSCSAHRPHNPRPSHVQLRLPKRSIARKLR